MALIFEDPAQKSWRELEEELQRSFDLSWVYESGPPDNRERPPADGDRPSNLDRDDSDEIMGIRLWNI